MANEVECNEVEPGVIASLLDSGATLANASHAAALIAGAGALFAAHSIAARLAFAGALLCWFVECALAVRTRIDASLFRMLAREPAARMDQVLVRWGLVKKISDRDMEGRCRGALRLWRLQIAAFVVQCGMLTLGLIFSGTG